MAGSFPPETENPDPEVEAEWMTTGTVPVAVTVSDFDTDVPTATLPKAIEVALRPRDWRAAFNSSEVLFDAPPALAVSVAV